MSIISKGFKGGAGGKFAFTIRGINKIVNKINQLDKKYMKNINIHANRIGILLVAEIHKLIKSGYYRPIWDTGTLFRTVMYTPPLVTHTTVEIDVSVQVFYAIFVHEGTKWMEKRPFMVDALKNKKNEIKQEVNMAFGLTGVL